MQKFEQLDAEDQVQLVLETLRMMCDAKQPTIEKLISVRDCAPRQLWREICGAMGYDECTPWRGWPQPPKRDFMKNAPGADRPLPDYLQKLLDRWKADYPHFLARQ